MHFKIKRYARIETGMPPEVRPGLGDRIARVAKPIARGIDRVLGTRLQDCAGCDDRQRWVNEKFPL